MTIEEINNLNLEENYSVLLLRILDGSNPPEGESLIWYDFTVEGSVYDKWQVNDEFEKPTLLEIEAEFILYKDELIANEEARLAEIARVNAIKARWNAIADIRYAMVKSSLNIPNSEMLLKQIIEDNDIEKLELLESKSSEIAAEVAINASIARSAAKRNLGISAMNYLNALNEAKNLSTSQVSAMLVALQTPKLLLESGSINTAIAYITGMTLPDNITESDRTKILAFLSSGLAEIE